MSPPGVVLDLLQPAARKQQPGLERGWLSSESEGRSLALVGDQAVAGTPAPFRSADKYSAAGEVVYVLRRCVVEHLAMRAHLATVRLPLKSSIRRLRTFIWRSLMGTSATICQNRALARMAVMDASALWRARSRQPRNHTPTR